MRLIRNVPNSKRANTSIAPAAQISSAIWAALNRHAGAAAANGAEAASNCGATTAPNAAWLGKAEGNLSATAAEVSVFGDAFSAIGAGGAGKIATRHAGTAHVRTGKSNNAPNARLHTACRDAAEALRKPTDNSPAAARIMIPFKVSSIGNCQ